jgi:hypothetical protein
MGNRFGRRPGLQLSDKYMTSSHCCILEYERQPVPRIL